MLPRLPRYHSWLLSTFQGSGIPTPGEGRVPLNRADSTAALPCFAEGSAQTQDGYLSWDRAFPVRMHIMRAWVGQSQAAKPTGTSGKWAHTSTTAWYSSCKNLEAAKPSTRATERPQHNSTSRLPCSVLSPCSTPAELRGPQPPLILCGQRLAPTCCVHALGR